jgi:hypothetical protein
LKVAADDTTLTAFVRSLCRFTRTVLESGRINLDDLAVLGEGRDAAQAAVIHREMRALDPLELIDAIQAHVKRHGMSHGRVTDQLEMLACDIFAHYELLVDGSKAGTALLAAIQSMAALEGRCDAWDGDQIASLAAWRETLVKALAEEFKINLEVGDHKEGRKKRQ